ncbi:DMT family transporter [Roseovarius atlanticus]|uniref:DMT family transporter n=1 Tax=Roseovarius atlanticus TaxID=1641875 RepID=UPI001C956503|nr:DMT family transporter [Roseovarius atlanticus]MBY5987932.1 DMT family transporter [Roseovarius atlanticus]MBY6123323.1 DMT family transporter [Roseovarius atlanticus]MBY6147818.1 DMT family transporter [Roseovarius atlanticus]
MSAGVSRGVLLALVGTVVLTPDAMLMRLSGMEGIQMTGWRGLFMGTMMLLAWAVTSRDRGGDMARLRSGPGAMIVVAQVLNSMLFCLGIASAPAAVVLMGVAAVPVFSALLSRVVTGETTSALTWAAIAAVMAGIGIAVLGGGHGDVALNWAAVTGAGFGLGVAFVLALNFVTVRASPDLPILLAIGVGAWIAGGIGWSLTGVEAMFQGRVWAMAVTGGVVLPVSFFLLSLAARHTLAANVSLLMLLETVLGPLWVWIGVGERPTAAMLVGGAIVVGSLTVYLSILRRRAALIVPR